MHKKQILRSILWLDWMQNFCEIRYAPYSLMAASALERGMDKSLQIAEARVPLDPNQEDRAQFIRDSLRDAIVDRRLAPGTKLSEAEVGTLFDVSRTVVRAALQDGQLPFAAYTDLPSAVPADGESSRVPNAWAHGRRRGAVFRIVFAVAHRKKHEASSHHPERRRAPA